MEAQEVDSLTQKVEEKRKPFLALKEALGQVVLGQGAMLDRLLVALLAEGHVLIEGVPGLAKTTTVRSLAKALSLEFSRIQFTPDLLPSDVTGTQVYNPENGTFSVKKGPIFGNLILADEINRAPSKVQAALLEAMEEKQVTIGDETFQLERPFMVLATQNPIEQEGTYPLPEAQMDRFMLKILLDYPKAEEEKAIADLVVSKAPPTLTPQMGANVFEEAKPLVLDIYMDEKLKDYAVALVQATRTPKKFGLEIEGLLEFGASPRATINLNWAARAWAFLEGRGYVLPEDIKNMAKDVLRHRIKPSYEALAEGLTSDHILKKILDAVPIP